MKKLAILSFIFAITCSGQVFSMEEKTNNVNVINNSQQFVIDNRINEFLNKHRNLTIDEKQNLRTFELWSYEMMNNFFNVQFSYLMSRVYDVFYSKASDKELITKVHDIFLGDFFSYINDSILIQALFNTIDFLKKYAINNSKNFVGENIIQMEKVFTNNKLRAYVNDILHNNMYKICTTKKKDVNTCDIPQYRKKILENIHDQTSEMEKDGNNPISVLYDYKVSKHSTDYNDFTILDDYFSKLEEMFRQFATRFEKLNRNEKHKYIVECDKLIKDGFITNPYIVDYIYDKSIYY